ncbi:MAG: hypothetical protein WD048_11940 [Chitinophagales bacterium]
MKNKEYSCQPKDSHPNAYAHKLFAGSIVTFIKSERLAKPN